MTTEPEELDKAGVEAAALAMWWHPVEWFTPGQIIPPTEWPFSVTETARERYRSQVSSAIRAYGGKVREPDAGEFERGLDAAAKVAGEYATLWAGGSDPIAGLRIGAGREIEAAILALKPGAK